MSDEQDRRLDELRFLGKVMATPSNLRSVNVEALRGYVCQAMGLTQLGADQQAYALGWLLKFISDTARNNLDGRSFEHLSSADDDCLIAAAAEHLGLVDDSALEPVVNTMPKGARAKTREAIRRPIGNRQVRNLRAAIWLGAIDLVTGRRRKGLAFGRLFDRLLVAATDADTRAALHRDMDELGGLDVDASERTTADVATDGLSAVLRETATDRGSSSSIDVVPVDLLPGIVAAFTRQQEAALSTRHGSDTAEEHEIVFAEIDCDEVRASISSRLPSATDEQVELLRLGLGGCSQIIDEACEYLRSHPEISVADYCVAIARDPLLVVESLGEAGAAFSEFVRRLVQRLSADHPRSLRLLELLAFVSHSYVPAELAMSWLIDEPSVKKADLPHASIAFDTALRPLNAYRAAKLDGFLLHTNALIGALARQILLAEHGPDYEAQVITNILRNYSCYDPEAFWRAGWGPFTTAGRGLCTAVSQIRAGDQESGVLRRDGKLGGAPWSYFIEFLWFRMSNAEYRTAESRAIIAHLRRKSDHNSVLALIDRGTSAIQLAEYRRIDEREEQIKLLASGAAPPQDVSLRGFIAATAEVLELQFATRFETPIGVLNLCEYADFREASREEFTEYLVGQLQERGIAVG